jgi:hypothetical protein
MVGNNRNIFVERVLPGSILRKLTDEEMTEFRRPFLDPADRRPTLTGRVSCRFAGALHRFPPTTP